MQADSHNRAANVQRTIDTHKHGLPMFHSCRLRPTGKTAIMCRGSECPTIQPKRMQDDGGQDEVSRDCAARWKPTCNTAA
eukprot:12452342-Alexandrium_andersonii.AAC.1